MTDLATLRMVTGNKRRGKLIKTPSRSPRRQSTADIRRQSTSWFGKAPVKFCGRCGKGTVKKDRVKCKHCGAEGNWVASISSLEPLERALLEAAGRGKDLKSQQVEKMAKAGVNPEVCDEDGLTPAMLAAKSNHSHNLSMLLKDLGANVNAQDSEGPPSPATTTSAIRRRTNTPHPQATQHCTTRPRATTTTT